jgi:hypothetical protein
MLALDRCRTLPSKHLLPSAMRGKWRWRHASSRIACFSRPTRTGAPVRPVWLSGWRVGHLPTRVAHSRVAHANTQHASCSCLPRTLTCTSKRKRGTGMCTTVKSWLIHYVCRTFMCTNKRQRWRWRCAGGVLEADACACVRVSCARAMRTRTCMGACAARASTRRQEISGGESEHVRRHARTRYASPPPPIPTLGPTLG